MSVSPPSKAAPPLMPLTGAAKVGLAFAGARQGTCGQDPAPLRCGGSAAVEQDGADLAADAADRSRQRWSRNSPRRFATGLNFIGSVKDVKGLLADAIASEPAQAAAAAAPTEVPVWEIVAKQQPEMLQLYLLKEHPQTIAVILSKIGSEPAAAIIGTLPAQLRNTLLARMLNIKSIEPGALQVVEATLREGFCGRRERRGAHSGIADILNRLDKSAMRRGPQALCRNATRRRQSSEAAAIHLCRAAAAAGQGSCCPVRSGADRAAGFGLAGDRCQLPGRHSVLAGFPF